MPTVFARFPAARSTAAALLLTSCTVVPIEGGIVILSADPNHVHDEAESTSPAAVAGAIALLLVRVAENCRALDRVEYRIDCLGAGYARAAEGIPTDATFGDARAAVTDAARSLRALAARNRDEARPAIEAPAQGGPIRAVEADRLAAAQAEALAILDRAATVLLRSSDTVPDAVEPYQKIAAALDSGKLLLRS